MQLINKKIKPNIFVKVGVANVRVPGYRRTSHYNPPVVASLHSNLVKTNESLHFGKPCVKDTVAVGNCNARPQVGNSAVQKPDTLSSSLLATDMTLSTASPGARSVNQTSIPSDCQNGNTNPVLTAS